jgi:hypothetical protein
MEHGPAPGHDANRPVQGLEDSHVLYTTTRAGTGRKSDAPHPPLPIHIHKEFSRISGCSPQGRETQS